MTTTSTSKSASNPFGALAASSSVIGTGTSALFGGFTATATKTSTIATKPSAPTASTLGAPTANEDEDSGEEGENVLCDDTDTVEESTTVATGTNGVAFVPHESGVVLETGEEGEVMVMQVRSKVFRMGVKCVPASGSASGSGCGNSLPSLGSNHKPETKMDANSESSPSTTTTTTTTANTKAMEWIEVGTGPLRLLSTDSNDSNEKSYRIVMRREISAGGNGTKLLLNILLQSECVKHSKLGDKALRISCMEASQGQGKSGSGSGLGLSSTVPSVQSAGELLESSTNANTNTTAGSDSGSGFEPVTYLIRVKNATVSVCLCIVCVLFFLSLSLYHSFYLSLSLYIYIILSFSLYIGY